MSPKFILVHYRQRPIYLNLSHIVSFSPSNSARVEDGTYIATVNSTEDYHVDETVKELKEIINLSLC